MPETPEGRKQKQDKKTTVKRSFGKKKSKIENYFKYNYPRNKLYRILKHNGLAAAEKWAAEHGAGTVLRGIINKKS